MQVFLKIFFFTCLIHGYSSSQIAVIENVSKGGLFYNGASFGQGISQQKIGLNFPVNSINQRLFFFTYSIREPDSTALYLNNQPIHKDSLYKIAQVNHTNPGAVPIRMYFKDITNILSQLNEDSISLKILINCPDIVNCGFWAGMIFGTYDMPGQTQSVTYKIYVGDQDLLGYENYLFQNFNPKTSSTPVAFSLGSDRACQNLTVPDDSTYIYMNGVKLGQIAGDDIQNIVQHCSGAQGNFIFHGNHFSALNDDNIDFQMNQSDALSEISTLVGDFVNSVNLNLRHFNYEKFGSPPAINEPKVHMLFTFAYETPCDTFSVNVTPNQLVCRGETVQLVASGGVAYEWSPQVGLSCYDCPNPTFVADSSIAYQVRIFNNDSCHVVRTTGVHVSAQPTNVLINTFGTECGETDGAATIKMKPLFQHPFIWIVDGDTLSNQSTEQNFNQLAQGVHTISWLDQNNCQFDTTFIVPVHSYTLTNATFNAFPDKGQAPHLVTVQNHSKQYTDTAWYINNQYVGSQLNEFTFLEKGEHQIKLVIYNNLPECIDSMIRTIYVYDNLVVSVPNVFTPNGDGANDVFGITLNQPAHVDYQFRNRWGQVLSSDNKQISSEGFTPLWDGGDQVEGVYFYIITVTGEESEPQTFQGFVHLEK